MRRALGGKTITLPLLFVCFNSLFSNLTFISLRSSIIDFEGPANFLFVMSTGSESISFSTAMPAPSSIKKKCIVCVKARDSTDEPGFTCIADEIIFMEICRPVLDNLY